MTSVRATLAIALSALAFAACGGGGGDDDGETDCTATPTAPGCGGGGGGGSSNQAPVAVVNGPYTGTANADVLLNAAGSRDPDGSIASYTWEFGDGQTLADRPEPAPTHRYAAPGTYTVRLTVKDDKGSTATATTTATITAPPAAGAGTLTVALTDAPFPFDSVAAVNVFVVRVEGRVAPATDADLQVGLAGDNANTNPAAGFVTVANVNRAVNLLTLQGGKTLTLGSVSLPAGNYAGFRMVIDASQSSITLGTGATPATVTWGAAGRIGLRVLTSEAVAVPSGGTKNMIVDFDVGKSFPLKGARASGGFNFAPYLNYITPQYTGRIAAQVLVGPNPFRNVTVELLANGTALTDEAPEKVIQTTASDSLGNYRFGYVLPGTYTLRATPPAASGFAAQKRDGVVVTAGQVSPARAFTFEPIER